MGEPAPRKWTGTNQRAAVRMTADEIEQFLRGRHTMVMSTIDHRGDIHSVAMWYGFVGDVLAVETKRASQKIANLRRNPRTTCLVEDGDRYELLRGVELVGTAMIVDDPDELRTLALSVHSRYVGGPLDDKQIAAMVHNRVLVKLSIERMVSWDHRKLGLSLPQGSSSGQPVG